MQQSVLQEMNPKSRKLLRIPGDLCIIPSAERNPKFNLELKIRLCPDLIGKSYPEKEGEVFTFTTLNCLETDNFQALLS